MTYVKHALAILLGAALIFFGAQKFGAENFIFERIADRSGISLFEPLIRRVTGVMEIIGGLMLLLPATRSLGALVATGVVGGAILFHLSPWLGVHTPMEAGGEESIGLFITALVLFGLAFINLLIYRKSLPIIGTRLP